MFVACHSNNGAEQDNALAVTSTISSAQFDSSIHQMVNDYLLLKDNFIAANDSLINFYAHQLMKDADSLNFLGFTSDSVTAQQTVLNMQSISAEMQGLLGETNLNGKLKSLYLLSEEFFDVLQLVHYSQQNIYRFECDSALEGSNASWLSNSALVHNPYQPDSHCGHITNRLNIATR
jgi:Cu(I)/Ag(I) efflux system membrane fusion protein